MKERNIEMSKQIQSSIEEFGKNIEPEVFHINNRKVERLYNGSWVYRPKSTAPLLPLSEASVNIINELIENLTNCPIKPKGSLLELLEFLKETLKIQKTLKKETNTHHKTNVNKRNGLRLPNKIYKTKLLGTFIYFINQYVFELINGKTWIVTDDEHLRQPITVLSLPTLIFLDSCLRKCINDAYNYDSSLHKEIETMIAASSKLECTIGNYKFRNTGSNTWTMTNIKNGECTLVTEAGKDFLRRLCKVLDDTPVNHPDYNMNLHNFIKLTCGTS